MRKRSQKQKAAAKRLQKNYNGPKITPANNRKRAMYLAREISKINGQLSDIRRFNQ